MTPTTPPLRRKPVNVRTPEVMDRVKAEVETHYRSHIVEKLRKKGGVLTIGNTTLRLAKQFGFCYGVERAIDLAYASRRVFPDQNIYLIGEIIHNPEVNRQLVEMGIRNLVGPDADASVDELTPEDVVIVPAFGAEAELIANIKNSGCQIVDTTCGDVMSVWKRVRRYARKNFTSIIHGKASHEETRATASRATNVEGGHYLVILTLDDTDYVCDYIRNGGDSSAFLERFKGGYSDGFDPDTHLYQVGVANQTTMLKSETEELQRRVAAAVRERDGNENTENFEYFDTICGATQERQDALFEMLERPMDILLVVGGYNSSNTTHLVEIGERQLPTFFIRDAECLCSFKEIVHFDLHKSEEVTSIYTESLLGEGPVTIGITAGASCPNNLIEATIIQAFELRGISRDDILES
ncbi:MAG: 4-hydroxy-3-methylbut-2-enyl diphosphate reductase [Verrucomicrobiales bacterium]|nr:4-hydroxy-3-methylbut-2-enyl diphosphate reductase [Verrucomicrobiaceae bacterium]